jgi:hypothetical protein
VLAIGAMALAVEPRASPAVYAIVAWSLIIDLVTTGSALVLGAVAVMMFERRDSRVV